MPHDSNPHLTCEWDAPIDWDELTVGDIPDEPGFYAFTDFSGANIYSVPKGGSVLYIGIATGSLRNRLRSYKNGDLRSVHNLHRGGLMLVLSRASSAGLDDKGRVIHSIQRKPVQVITRRAGQAPQHSTIDPNRIYIRWAVDPRAAIEAMLIRTLNPRFNTMHASS